MTNNPFSALIAGVPRYSFTGERLIKSADGVWEQKLQYTHHQDEGK